MWLLITAAPQMASQGEVMIGNELEAHLLRHAESGADLCAEIS